MVLLRAKKGACFCFYKSRLQNYTVKRVITPMKHSKRKLLSIDLSTKKKFDLNQKINLTVNQISFFIIEFIYKKKTFFIQKNFLSQLIFFFTFSKRKKKIHCNLFKKNHQFHFLVSN